MPPREPTSSNCERWSQVPGRLRREGVEGAHARAAGRQAAPAETWTWGYQAARKPTVRGSPGLRTGTPSRGNLTAALSQRSGRLSDANGHPGRSGCTHDRAPVFTGGRGHAYKDNTRPPAGMKQDRTLMQQDARIQTHSQYPPRG
ncbi:uncharacterized protein LOC115301365 isoform X6 [Suricata suricatta]|uniref:uncharacterized protein LOC115301365 isoform X6 n=1 Tax=Suricata suricatta TaxID=37032 RepID=UPI001155339B|nr:uncharacterized protein LOC115301365 isoform X6 [Suricata suricatta]